MDYSAIVLLALHQLLLISIPVVGGYAVTWLHKHIKATTLATGMEIARMAVHATEQMSKNGSMTGGQKYNIAITQAHAFADRLGVHFSDAEWQSVIEQAVHEMNGVLAAIAEPLPVQVAPSYSFPSFTNLPMQVISAPTTTTSLNPAFPGSNPPGGGVAPPAAQ